MDWGFPVASRFTVLYATSFQRISFLTLKQRIKYAIVSKGYTAKQLDTRFAFEDELVSQGQPIKGKAFFIALKEKLKECDD